MAFLVTGVRPTGVTPNKEAFVEGTIQFLRAVNTVHVKEMIVESEQACVIVLYELLSPKGNSASMDVAEILVVKHGNIDAATCAGYLEYPFEKSTRDANAHGIRNEFPTAS